MKIAQIAPLAERCPPRLYGGTERIVSYLTEELVRLGHEVTLFASGDSQTRARLVPGCATSLRLLPESHDPLPHTLGMLDMVRKAAADFDILHFHLDYLHYPLASAFAGKMVTTLHGRLDSPDNAAFYRTFPDYPLVSISQAQRLPMPPVRWAGTVYHGLPPDLLAYTDRPAGGGYLAFLGRISPEKRPDRAIEIAERAGLPLKIAAKVDRADTAYWEDVIRPLIARHEYVEYIGEIAEDRKPDFLGQASALLFPIDWPEPFGLVMIEAMACGTPVIAYRNGSVPEVVDDGITGFVVDDIASAVDAVHRAAQLSRAGVRARFEKRFTANRMTREYLAIYRAYAGLRPAAHAPPRRRLKSVA